MQREYDNVFTAISDPDMHHGTCTPHIPWCMPESLPGGFLWSRWRGKRYWHSRRMRSAQCYVSGKMSIDVSFSKLHDADSDCVSNSNSFARFDFRYQLTVWQKCRKSVSGYLLRCRILRLLSQFWVWHFPLLYNRGNTPELDRKWMWFKESKHAFEQTKASVKGELAI